MLKRNYSQSYVKNGVLPQNQKDEKSKIFDAENKTNWLIFLLGKLVSYVNWRWFFIVIEMIRFEFGMEVTRDKREMEIEEEASKTRQQNRRSTNIF